MKVFEIEQLKENEFKVSVREEYSKGSTFFILNETEMSQLANDLSATLQELAMSRDPDWDRQAVSLDDPDGDYPF